MKRRSIYLDHAATTPCDKRVVNKMLPYFDDSFGNPSGIYKISREAKFAIDQAREVIARFLGCIVDEVLFTNGGTESDNMAILGYARKCKKGHIITSKIEHSAVLNSCRQLEKEGFDITYLPVDKNGLVSAKQVGEALKPETILVSIMYANNEIGTIEPVEEIAKRIKEYRTSKKSLNPIFHTDACQATQYLEMNVEKLGVDMLTFNGSKIYGPKGIGVLFVKNGVKIDPILFGGEQEKGIRPGTENVPAIVGLGEAVRLIDKKSGLKEQELRDTMIEKLLKIENSELNGDKAKRLPNNINVAFYGIEGESAILYLDEVGIACSAGSACLSKTLEPSHVILALGKGREAAHSSLRFTIGRSTSRKDIEDAAEKITDTIERLREMSAVNKSKVKS